MSSETYHEDQQLLTEDTRDMHRAIQSLMEELEAVDWYQQRVDATKDSDLAAILGHNRDEEIEHAMMVLEWLRRRTKKFDEHARTYLFTEGPITGIEEVDTGKSGGGADDERAQKEGAKKPDGSLGIGSLKPKGKK